LVVVGSAWLMTRIRLSPIKDWKFEHNFFYQWGRNVWP
jgi:hypothetical protein